MLSLIQQQLERLEDEIIPNIDLFRLLNINKDREQLQSNAIIREIRQNPQWAAKKYEFLIYAKPNSINTRNRKDKCYALHRAIFLGANVDVLEAIYDSYPPAIEDRKNEDSYNNALYHALDSWKPVEVPLFILQKYPAAALEMDSKRGSTPLHYALYSGAPFKVVARLLQIWPDAAMARNNYGLTPLHIAASRQAQYHSLARLVGIVALILKYCPKAARIKDNHGFLPLHADFDYSSLPVVLMLIEMWPFGVMERNRSGMTPLDVYRGRRRRGNPRREENVAIEKVLSHVYKICDEDSRMDNDLSREMMDFFIDIQWWKGMILLLDRYPPLTKLMDLETNVFPDFLSMVGRCCSIKTMWQVISNELDIMEGV